MTPETATACPRAEGGFDALTKVTFYIWISTLELNQDFSIHHEAHEEQTTGLGKRPDFNMIFSSFVLFVSFVVVYSVSNTEFRIKYQQYETLTVEG
jgi:hypothetical protein